MKMLTVLSAFALASAGVQSSWAADYYLKSSVASASSLGAVWYSVDNPDADPVEASAGNTYWVVNGKELGVMTSYSGTIPGTVCLGTASNYPPSTSKNGTLAKGGWFYSKFYANIIWYNGRIQTNSRYAWGLYNPIKVMEGGEGSDHRFYVQDVKDANAGVTVYGNISSDSEDLNINVEVRADQASLDSAKAVSGNVGLNGDNSGYKGTFTLVNAYAVLSLGGTHPLGSPNVPNAAALKVANNAFVRMIAEHPTQSPNRGIRLDGAAAYFMSGAAASTLDYAISRNDGADGRLIKIGSNKLTLNGPYSAGVIEVSEGTLAFGRNATMPANQAVVVRDGATLLLNYAPGVGKLDVTTEGTGAVVYQDGYRQDADGNWEVRVKASVTGDGTVSPTEQWVRPGEKVTFSAVDGAQAFVRWSGDIEAAGRGADVFARSFTVETGDAAPSVVANFGTLTKPEDATQADGTTYVFADRVLTITVPTDVVHVGAYGSLVTDGYVTNIVKQGAGRLNLAAVADYCGSFAFAAGSVAAGDVGVLGADDAGTVVLGSGVTLAVTTSSVIASRKKLLLAGTVKTETVKNESRFLQACDIRLTDNLTWSWSSNKRLYFPGGGSVIDVAGHKINLSCANTYENISLSGVVITNSVPESSTSMTCPTYDTIYLDGNTALKGGPGNTLNYGWDAFISVRSIVDTDWTLDANTLCTLHTPDNQTANTTNYQWRGAFKATYGGGTYGNIKINNVGNDNCLTLAGPISGAGKVDVHGGILNILSQENTYSGQMSLYSTKSKNLRSCICVWDGAVFSAGATKPVAISNGDFWIGENTAFSLPSYNHTSGTCRFSGGPSADKPCGRASLVNFTKSGDSTTLTIDSPVILAGKTDIQVGTLALGEAPKTAAELPVFSNLVFAAGTTFDMHGNDLTVPNLTGFPTVLNPGTLTIAGNWTVDFNDVKSGKTLDLGSGSLAFAPGATITFVNRTGSLSEDVILARAAAVTGTPGLVGWKRRIEIADGELKLVAPGGVMILK